MARSPSSAHPRAGMHASISIHPSGGHLRPLPVAHSMRTGRAPHASTQGACHASHATTGGTAAGAWYNGGLFVEDAPPTEKTATEGCGAPHADSGHSPLSSSVSSVISVVH